MREGLTRLAVSIVIIAFCIPLFIGLGRTDLGNDEAIYSYAVDSILETGDWLSPRASPNPHLAFLEKPPLKFWIVAAPIHLGVLARSEFGLRFWDALFGSVGFLYIFALGHRLAGPLCGAFAVLILFAHAPLIFEHGLRSNNMEAALLLAYAGGIYHYLRWTRADAPRRASLDVASVALYFFLAFMTKFVASFFLPAVLGVCTLLVPGVRRTFRRDWRLWIAAALGFVLLAAPWFVYQYMQRGHQLWHTMFDVHVVTRFTEQLDPTHVQPWHFYMSQMYRELQASHAVWWVAVGLVLLVIAGIRMRSAEILAVILWAVVPVVAISAGSSKVYHYLYPFIPPFALAGGYAFAQLCAVLTRFRVPQPPSLNSWRTPAVLRIFAAVVLLGAIAVAVGTAIFGGARIDLGGSVLLRNTAVWRPLLVASACLALVAGLRPAAVGAAFLLLAAVFPTPLTAYRKNLSLLPRVEQPLRRLSDCIASVDTPRQRRGEPVRGVYAPVTPEAFIHPYFFYLRGRGWHSGVDDDAMRQGLFSPDAYRPIAIDVKRYLDFLDRTSAPASAFLLFGQVLVLLPGPYEMCLGSQVSAR